MGEPDRKPLVLVVDDFADNREMFADYLVFSGFEVVQAGSGTEALELAFAKLPDLVLMDLSLPGIDGWEATRRLKTDERTRDVLVIAVTGHTLRGHAEGARQAGCDAFVAKPCMPEELLRQVRLLLEQRGAKRRPPLTGS